MRVWVVGDSAEAGRHHEAWATFAPRVSVQRVALGSAQDVAREAAAGAPVAASVCAPLPARAGIAAALLEAGAHVLLETPVAFDEANAHALASTAERAGRLLVPAHPLLYTPGMARLMAYVFARRLGPVQNVYAYRYGPSATRLRYEPAERDAAWETNALASFVKTLCLLPESRFGAVRGTLVGGAQRDESGRDGTGQYETDRVAEPTFEAAMYYEDDILATVLVDPEKRPPRRGVMVTLVGGVLQWEVDEVGERLTLQRGTREQALPLGAEVPSAELPAAAMTHRAMVGRFLKSIAAGEAPYEDAAAAIRSVTLAASWRAALMPRNPIP